MQKQPKPQQQILSNKYRKGSIISRHEVEEFGPGKIDIIFCPEGDEVYYYKSWHHNLRRYPHLKETKPLRFQLCPYHQMKKNRQWEGEVRIYSVPEKYRERVLKTAENVSREAYRRDPMHRILNIKENKKEITIYTSENQLAQRMAKKIFESFKNHFFRQRRTNLRLAKPKISRGQGSDAVLITMEWIK